MTQPIQIIDQVFAIPEPEDAWIFNSENWRTDYVINMGYLTYPRVGKKKWLSLPGMEGIKMPGLDYNERAKGVIKLPEGNWQIICTTKEVTAMHAPALFGYAMLSDHYARETIKALLTAKGLDSEKNYVLIKKIR